MNLPSEERESVKCRASRRAAESREEVQSFFSDNWTRLRSLIMQMEEQSWEQDGSQKLSPTSPAFASSHSETGVTSDNSLVTKPDSRTGNADAGAADRLTELARQIDQRIRINLAQNR